MPERRIDAVGKADAATWNASQQPKNAANMVRVISGSLSHIPTGQVMRGIVQRADNGSFKVTLNGESFIVKGLPASLVGKEVSFIVQQNMQQGKLKAELFWTGASQKGNTTKQSSQSTLSLSTTSLAKHGQQANILSSLPSGLKSGQSMSARVDSMSGKQMQISLMMQDAKDPSKSIRHQILTSNIDGFKVGQQFKGNIQFTNNLTSSSLLNSNQKAVLNIISQQQAVKGDATGKITQANFKLSIGDTTAGIVQKRLPNGLVQLNIQGVNVETAAPAGIKKGDVLMLKLTKLPSEFQLLSIQKDAAGKALATHKANFSLSNQSIGQQITSMRNTSPALPASETATTQTLTRLDSAMKAFEVSALQPLNGQRLASMMQHSGNSLEAKLLNLSQNPALSPSLQHDLKSIMLQLSNAQGGGGTSSQLLHKLTELAQQGLARIESGQSLNVLAQMQQDPIRMELPMLVGQQVINVQLSMQQNASYEGDQGHHDKGSSDQSYSILFALDLSQLGHVRVDANISDNSVHARIYNAQPDSHQFIQENIQRLEERLKSLGFEEVYLISSQQQPKADKQQRFDQLTQMMPAAVSLNLLDIRI